MECVIWICIDVELSREVIVRVGTYVSKVRSDPLMQCSHLMIFQRVINYCGIIMASLSVHVNDCVSHLTPQHSFHSFWVKFIQNSLSCCTKTPHFCHIIPS